MSAKLKLPQRVQEFLSKPKKRGHGLNNWLFCAALKLHPYLNDSEIIHLLGSLVEGEPLQLGEIERAVERSRDWKPGDGVTQSRGWPSVDHNRRGEIIANGDNFDALCELSPLQLEDGVTYTEAIIDSLYPGNPLLCVAKSIKRSQTKLKSEWCGALSKMQFIVPSPMTARTGKTQDGKASARALDNAGPRRFLVIEQDSGTYDEQAAVLLHLAKEAPLALVVFSGNRSLHGWFYCAGQPEEKLHQFMMKAVSLGADRATWTRSQLVRIPDGTRDNGQRQTVYYFNPEVIR
jgi:hypothetical protein